MSEPGESAETADHIWDGNYEVDEDSSARDARRTKVIALSGLAAVVVIALVTIVLVSVFVDTTPPSPTTPAAAAEQWGDALVHGRTARQHALECEGRSARHDQLQLLPHVASGVHAGRVRRSGTDRWRVTLHLDGTLAGAYYPVLVVRRNGDYLVC